MTQHAQALQALRVANRIRVDAAAVRREVREGSLSIVDAFDDDRAGVLSCERLLMAQRQWGVWRARRFLEMCQIPPTKKVRALTARQAGQIQGLVQDPEVLKRMYYF